MVILDTDHISILQHEDSLQAVQLLDRLSLLADHEVATTVVTMEEQPRSWLSLTGRYSDVTQQVAYYDRFVSMFEFYGDWQVLPCNESAATQFQELRRQKIRIATPDLKIASIALLHNATLLSRNLKDFRKVPNLKVENWLDTQST